MLRRDVATKSDEYPEEVLGGAGVDCAVLNLGLFSEIFGRFDGRLHALDGEEGGEVRCVRRDDDERKEPPDASDYTTRHRPAFDKLHHFEQATNSCNSTTQRCKNNK